MSLTDFESTIKQYIKNRLEEEFPELSTAEGDPLADMFYNPLIEVLKPVIDLANRTDIIQDLSNADIMTEDELDRIGENNYGVTRNPGDRASGYVYVQMDPEYVTDTVIIGPIVVSTSDNRRYSNNTSTIIKYTSDDVITTDGTILSGTASDYLNIATGVYEFPIYVEADDLGSTYNVDPGDINTLVTKYPLLNDVVANKQAFTNGLAKESNTDYANRIISSLFVKLLGTSEGYRSYLIRNFDNLRDAYIAGYGDPVMNRDIAIVKEHGILKQKHIGGKVDIYVRGSSYEDTTQTAYLVSDKVRLVNPRLKNENSIIVKDLLNPVINDLQVELIYENPDTKTGWVEARVVPGLSGIYPVDGDELELRYISYMDDTETDTLLYVQRFYYNSDIIRINTTPFGTLTGIDNLTTGQNISFSINGTDVSDSIYATRRQLPIIERGVCSAIGNTSTEVVLDTDEAVESEDFYVGGTIYLVNGTGGGQNRVIESYDIQTHTAVVDSAWDTLPDTTTEYIIRAASNNKEESAADTIDIGINMDYTVLVEGSNTTSLVSDITSTATSLEVDVDTFPAVPFYLKIDDEVVEVTEKLSTTFTITRGQNYTEQAAHTAGTSVVEMVEQTVFNSGDKLELTYTYNKLVNDIQKEIDTKENRIITTDVLTREAIPKYIFFGFKIKCKKGTSITSEEKLILSSVLEDILQATSFNSQLQISDIISDLYKHSSVAQFLDYIQMPVKFFSSDSSTVYITKDDGEGGTYTAVMTEEDLLDSTDTAHQSSNIILPNATYPVLGMLAIQSIEY